MAARLFVGHHRRPHAVGVEILARVIEQALRIGLAQSGREAFAYQAALPVTSVGIEPVPDDRATIADDVGHHRNQTRRHPRKIDVGVVD